MTKKHPFKKRYYFTEEEFIEMNNAMDSALCNINSARNYLDFVYSIIYGASNMAIDPNDPNLITLDDFRWIEDE